MASIRKIAERAGVSISTVSLVINEKPGVSEEMRAKVRDAMQQLGAENPSWAASRRSRTSAAQNLSFLVLHPPVPASYYVFSQVLQGIQAAAETNRVLLRLVPNDPQMTDDHVAYRYLSDPDLCPDGLLMFGARHTEPLLDRALEQRIPCVVLGRDPSSLRFSALGRDEFQIAANATQYLLDLGHRAIGFAGGDDAFDYVHTRIKGYRHALEKAGIDLAPQWIERGSGATATASILDHAPEITALIFVNDSFAAGGLPVIAERGLHIPADLSVLSFDDTDIARSATPPLTAVSYAFYEEGQWAVKMLLDQIRTPYLEQVHTYFKAELIQRESCAPPR